MIISIGILSHKIEILVTSSVLHSLEFYLTNGKRSSISTLFSCSKTLEKLIGLISPLVWESSFLSMILSVRLSLLIIDAWFVSTVLCLLELLLVNEEGSINWEGNEVVLWPEILPFSAS